MYTFARAILGTIVAQLIRRLVVSQRRHTIARAVTFGGATKAYQPDEHISFQVDVNFPQQWLELEKRVPVCFLREEAEDMLLRELRDDVVFGEEAIKLLNLRRRYLNGDEGFHGAKCRLK